MNERESWIHGWLIGQGLICTPRNLQAGADEYERRQTAGRLEADPEENPAFPPDAVKDIPEPTREV